jgi:hypothetical protein
VSANIVRIVSDTRVPRALAKPKPSPVWQQLQKARKAGTTPKREQFAGGAEGGFTGRRSRR